MRTLTSGLISVILIFFICVDQGEAFPGMRNRNYCPNDLATATGTIEAIGLNFIQIRDEDQKRLKKFIYFEQREGFNQGAYVRVYYRPETDVVMMIKRMTVLEYKKNGQNLGYISR